MILNSLSSTFPLSFEIFRPSNSPDNNKTERTCQSKKTNFLTSTDRGGEVIGELKPVALAKTVLHQ